MSKRKTALEKNRNYFLGDINVMYSGFISRFKDPEVTIPLSIQNFVTQNEIRAIIEKRVSLMPVDEIRFHVLDPKTKKRIAHLDHWLNGWLEGAHFGDGCSFMEFVGEILLCLELDGETALKVIIRDGMPTVRRIPDDALEIITNPDNVYKITAFVAKWKKELEGEDFQSEVQIKETIDGAGYLFESDGKAKKEKHDFGFIPLVLIKREDSEGSPHGRSGISDLIEPQDNLNRCLTNIARANKYGPWGLYCTEDSGAPLPDGDITVAPGSLVATPIKKVSGDGAADCLFKEKTEILDSMYRIAGISRDKIEEMARVGATSGKALVILNAQGRRYVKNLQARLKRGFARLCRYALVMSGEIKQEQDVIVSVDFPDLDKEDPSLALDKAKLLFDVGLAEEALATLGFENNRIKELLGDQVMESFKDEKGIKEYDA